MFNNITIKARLIFVLSFLSVLLVIIGGIGLYGMQKMDVSLKSVYEDRTVPLDQLTQIGRLILRNRIAILHGLKDPTEEEIRARTTEVDDNIVEIGKIWEAYMATYLTPEEKVLATKFAEDRGRFVKEALKPAVAALRAKNLKEVGNIIEEKDQTIYPLIRDDLNALVKLQIDVARGEYENGVALYNTIRNVAIGAIAIGLALAVFIGMALVRAIVKPLDEAVRLSGAIAAGDLTNTIEVTSNDETGRLLASMKAMNDNLSQLVGKINESASSVATGAKEISSGNTDLSQRTEEQASSLEETASSMEELTSTVKQNADNARQANQLANAAREQAEKGGEVVSRAVGAMSEINSSSKKIADIIGVIDEIAFQTNLLALNAAVEAARAGEQGRGFAVVATEVRNLAQRSAGSAKEIKDLIKDSVQKVEDGSRLVDESGVTLSEIVGSVKKVSDIVAEIAAASQEQSTGIEQVNKAVMQMDQMTQQNAALVEEAAAASKSMEDQAQVMADLMATFRTNQGSSYGNRASKATVSHAKPAARAAHAATPHKAATPASHSKPAAAPAPKAAPRAASSGGDAGDWEEF